MLKFCMLISRWVLLSMLLLCAVYARAKTAVEFNGFATQGFTYTDHNNFFGSSENGSFDFRELGVNTVWWLNDELLLSGQIVSRLAGELDDGSPSIDYLLLDYRFYEGVDGYAGFSFGRNKNPFGLYNKTRDVAFTRPSIILPQSLYFDRARNLELSSDGVRLYGSKFLESGVWGTELVVGIPRYDESIEMAYFFKDWEGELTSGMSYLLRTEYSPHDYRWIIGLNKGYFNLDFDGPDFPAPGAPGDGSAEIDVFALSFQYNLDRWSFTSEYLQQRVAWKGLGGIFAFRPEVESKSLYLQLEHRLSDDLTLFLRRDFFYGDRSDCDGERFEALFGRPANSLVGPGHSLYAHDWTLGIGWYPSKDWLLRAEWHNIEGTGWLPLQDNPDLSQTVKDWNMLSLQVTYKF